MSFIGNFGRKIGVGLVLLSWCLLILVLINKVNSEEKHPEKKNEENVENLPLVMAKVNGNEIKRDYVKMTQRSLEAQYAQMHKQLPSDPKEVLSTILEELIGEELMYQNAQSLKIPVNNEEVDKEFVRMKSRFPSEEAFVKTMSSSNITEQIIKGDLKKNLMINRLVRQEIESKVKVEEKSVKEYYDSNLSRFKEADSYKVSHILRKVNDPADNKAKEIAKEKIIEVQKKIKAGENFPELAKKYSEDLSAEKGGDLGFFSPGELVESFEKAVFSLKIGEISDVVETEFGYHIIKLFEKKEGQIIAFNEVKEDISKFLVQKDTIFRINQYVEELKKKAKIEKFY